MKRQILILVIALSSAKLYAQDSSFCVSITRGGQPEKVMAHFDSLYPPLGNTKLPDSVTIPKAWYKNFTPAFLEFLTNSNLGLDSTAKVWVDLCCSPSGKIERVLYTSGGFPDINREKKFCEAVEHFVKSYTFPITINRPYNQCGSFSLRPNKKK
jgi:hypothetical protein